MDSTNPFLCDDDFDFDFLEDDELFLSGNPGELMDFQQQIGDQRSTNPDTKIIKKCAGGGKLRKKIYRPRGYIDNNASVNSIQRRQFLRKKSSPDGDAPKLYAFPAFDPCDSLLFLPTTLVRLFNSGDLSTLQKEVVSRAAKTCNVHIRVLSDETLNPNGLITFFTIAQDVNPDIMMCVRSITITGNQIHAVVYTTFTATKAIYIGTSRTAKESVYAPLFSTLRRESLTWMLNREPISEEDRCRYLLLLEQDGDLVIQKKTNLTFTLHSSTKKLTKISVVCELISMEPVPVSSEA